VQACTILHVRFQKFSRVDTLGSVHTHFTTPFPWISSWSFCACFYSTSVTCTCLLMWLLQRTSDISCWLVHFWVPLCKLGCVTLLGTNRKSRKQFNVNFMYTHCIYLSYGELTSAVVLLSDCTSSLAHSQVTFTIVMDCLLVSLFACMCTCMCLYDC